MIKLIKEREYEDDVYTVVSEESMNMEDDLRGIYIDDSLDVLEDELSSEGFEYYDEGICIAPADCIYRIWKSDKYKVIIYAGKDDNIVYNLYVKERDNTLESIRSRRKRRIRESNDKWFQDTLTVVIDYFNKKQWDTNIPEVMNYAEAVAEQLNRDPDWVDGNYTMRDWYKDTYTNYPEDIEWLDSTAY